MTVTLIFLSLLMAVFVFWLMRQTINVRPWVAESTAAGHVPHVPAAATAPRIGLGVFLAVVTALFALAISAYMMRMEIGTDWRPMPEPVLLWGNTMILVLGSVFLQWAWHAAGRADDKALGLGLAAGGACTIAFIGGQLAVWLQLVNAGHYAAANPANAFFYLLTALHALHLLGGLVAWGGLVLKLRRGAGPAAVHGGVELCAVYWHYLLVLWAILFGLVLST